MLSKEQILKAKDLQTETVDVPEWGGKVVVMGMTGKQRDEFEQSVIKGKKTNMSNIRARLCQVSLVDEAGVLLFNSNDIAKLGGKSAAALDRCFEVASRLSGISKDDVEDLEKNSGKGRSEDSTSN